MLLVHTGSHTGAIHKGYPHVRGERINKEGWLVISGRPLQGNCFGIFRAYSLLFKRGDSNHK